MIFQKSLTSMKQTGRNCLFFFVFFTHKTQNQSGIIKQSAVEQRQDQDEVRHVWRIGVISFVLRQIPMWTPGIWKNFPRKLPNKVDFLDVILISQNLHLSCFNLMLDWRAMNVTVYLAPWSEGHSLSVQCYDFYLHSILFL